MTLHADVAAAIRAHRVDDAERSARGLVDVVHAEVLVNPAE